MPGTSSRPNPPPITRAQFLQDAPVIPVQIGNLHLDLHPRIYNTGSFGWHLSEHLWIPFQKRDAPLDRPTQDRPTLDIQGGPPILLRKPPEDLPAPPPGFVRLHTVTSLILTVKGSRWQLE